MSLSVRLKDFDPERLASLDAKRTALDALEKLTGILEAGLPESTRFLLSAVGPDKRRSFP